MYLLKQEGQELNDLVGRQGLHIRLFKVGQVLVLSLNWGPEGGGSEKKQKQKPIKQVHMRSRSYHDPPLGQSNAGVSQRGVVPETQQ